MIKIRKFVTIVEHVLSEMGQPADKPMVAWYATKRDPIPVYAPEP